MARSRPRQQTAALNGAPDDVEAAFYDSLKSGNLEKMMSVWADEDEIVCIHPGGPRLRGAGAIRTAFETLFAEGGTVNVSIAEVHRADGLGTAVHHVLERVEVMTEQGPVHAFILSTNVYLKTAQGWRMFLHHASPGTQNEIHTLSDGPKIFH